MVHINPNLEEAKKKKKLKKKKRNSIPKNKTNSIFF